MKLDYNKTFDLDFIEEFWDDLDIDQITRKQKLPQEFIDKHFKKLNPNLLIRYQELTLDYIKEKWEWFNKNVIAQYVVMPIEWIIEKWDDFRVAAMENIAKYQKLTTDFLNEKWGEIVAFSDSIIDEICRYQTMAVDFIVEKWDYLNTNYISKYQRLTVEFIKDNLESLNLAAIAAFQIISDSVRDLLGLSAPAKTITGNQILAFDPCADGMARYNAHTPDNNTVLTWNELLELHGNSQEALRDIHWLTWNLGKKINT